MSSVLDLIGNTPLVEVTRLDVGACRLFLKLESANPSGSIKDRPARAMIEAAEKDGRFKPGGTIVEATAGNTGLGLALVGSRKGYRIVLIVPDKMAREKILHAKAMGAEIVLTRSDVGKGHPDYYQDMAEAITQRTPGAIYINQFENPANPQSHYETTGPEILKQMEGGVDAVVVGVGSGGTLTGIGRFMKSVSPKTTMVLADPVGSVLAPYIETGKMMEAGSWTVEGIGEDFIPANCDLSLVQQAYSISDQEAFATARELLSKEGIFAGSSSGTLLSAALKFCREQREQSASSALSVIRARSTSRRSSMMPSWRRKVGPIARTSEPSAISSSTAIMRGALLRCSPATRCAPRSPACGRPTYRSFRWSIASVSSAWSMRATCCRLC